MKSYFQQANLLYGLTYAVWRGGLVLRSLLSTWFYRRVVEVCGKGVRFKYGIYMMYPKRISIGDDCSIGAEVSFVSESPKGRLDIRNRVQISDKVHIDFTGDVSIGEGTLISSGATIYSHDHGYDPRSRPSASSLTIGENVWIGFNATLLPGATRIGHDAIIGAGAIVSKPVAEWTIVAGNPAKPIKTLHSDVSQPSERK